ncbi:hypothetical protein, partial [Ructibacterium gallinarum]
RSSFFPKSAATGRHFSGALRPKIPGAVFSSLYRLLLLLFPTKPTALREPCGRRIQLVGTNKFKKKTFSRNQNDTLNSTIKKLLSHKMIAVKIVGRDNI